MIEVRLNRRILLMSRKDKRIDEIGMVVVDELRAYTQCTRSKCYVDMVGEPDRGSVLELLLTKVMHCGKGKIQIIGMQHLLRIAAH